MPSINSVFKVIVGFAAMNLGCVSSPGDRLAPTNVVGGSSFDCVAYQGPSGIEQLCIGNYNSHEFAIAVEGNGPEKGLTDGLMTEILNLLEVEESFFSQLQKGDAKWKEGVKMIGDRIKTDPILKSNLEFKLTQWVKHHQKLDKKEDGTFDSTKSIYKLLISDIWQFVIGQ